MKIDGPFYATLDTAVDEAKRLAEAGYDGVYTLEGNTDPFLPLVLAAQAAPGLDLATGIAVAFPRNPAHLAYLAWDLQKYSKGHFMLGLGSQVRAHIEKRFGCEFDQPARRMQELIEATKAFFNCFQNGEPLHYEGEFYRHTLMTPMFDAQPNPYGVPPILLGAVGPRMTRVAGEAADGLIVHPFNTRPFLENEQAPLLADALAVSGRQRSDFIVQAGAMVVTGNNEQEYEVAKQTLKGLLAFYGSTPAYIPPMKAVGLEDLQPTLNRLSKAGEWDKMSELVDDEFVEHFAVCGEPHEIGAKLLERYDGLVDRLSIYAPYQTDPDVWPGIIKDIKKISA